MVIDLGMQEIYIRKSKDRFKKEKETNLWTLPIQRKEQPKKGTEYSAYKCKKYERAVPTTNVVHHAEEVEEMRPCVKGKEKNEEHYKEENNGRRYKDDTEKDITPIPQEAHEEKTKENAMPSQVEYPRSENKEIVKV